MVRSEMRDPEKIRVRLTRDAGAIPSDGTRGNQVARRKAHDSPEYPN